MSLDERYGRRGLHILARVLDNIAIRLEDGKIETDEAVSLLREVADTLRSDD